VKVAPDPLVGLQSPRVTGKHQIELQQNSSRFFCRSALAREPVGF